jgi:hypothetical protein
MLYRGGYKYLRIPYLFFEAKINVFQIKNERIP